MNQPSQRPFRIQLALQGGAARIFALVAVLDAIQRINDELRLNEQPPLLEVTRVAGTSAGSIVGTLFAARISMREVKAKLAAVKLSDIVPARGRVTMAYKLGAGKAIWKQDSLQQLIQNLVDLSDPKVTTFTQIEREFGIPVHVLASDLRNKRSVVYQGDSPVVNSLLDSCAVPYGFRAANSGGDACIVDGGICENLPSAVLVQHVATSGPIVGVTFRKAPGKPPTNALEFSLAILDTAMDNSVERAKGFPGSLYEIDTSIGSFEWDRALTQGLDAEYDRIRLDAEKFFRGFVSQQRAQEEKARAMEVAEQEARAKAAEEAAARHGKITSDLWAAAESGDYWAKQYRAVMHTVGDIYELEKRETPILVECSRLKVIAYSLVDPNHPDEVHYQMEFRTMSRPVQCHGIGLSHADHQTLLLNSEYEVRGPRGERINTHRLLMYPGGTSQSQKIPTHRGLLLFFDPFLPVNSGPYILILRDAVKGFIQLSPTKNDDLAVSLNRSAADIKSVELVIQYPRSFSSLRMIAKQDRSEHLGHLMSNEELRKYADHAPLGFDTQGWIGQNIPSGLRFGVDLYL